MEISKNIFFIPGVFLIASFQASIKELLETVTFVNKTNFMQRKNVNQNTVL